MVYYTVPPVVYLAMGASVQHEVILKGYNVFFQCNVQVNIEFSCNSKMILTPLLFY